MFSDKEICDYYLSGKTLKECSNSFNTYPSKIRKILVKNGYKIRPSGTGKNRVYKHKTNGINPNYFNIIDCQEKAYFIGFIAADGYIHKNGYKLVIGLNIKDKEILEKFCKLTGCTNKISESKVFDKRTNKYYYHAVLQICSKDFVKTLEKYGLDNNKTKNYIIKNIPDEYVKDCIRGLIDGDGHISMRIVELITTLENIRFIQKWSLKHNIKSQNHIEEIKKENNVYKFYFGKDRFKLLDLIYNNSKIHLSRKYINYQKSKYKFENRTKIVKNRKVFVYKDGIYINEFNSLVECSRELKILACNISNQAAGRISHSHGYTFKLGEIVKNKIRVENDTNLS